MKKLAIGMMVKNEARIIERVLASVVPIADSVIITDTGSTDDTIIKAGLFLQSHNIKYKIYRTDFVDFAHNRNVVYDYAQQEPEIDYILMIDADEELVLSPNFSAESFKNNLEHDIYDVRITFGNTSYHLPRLLSQRAKSRYVGVIHEFLVNKGESYSIVDNISIHQKNDSNRRINNEKFSNDIVLMTKAFKDPETPANMKSRYAFYIAQTYHAIESHTEALEFYKLRTTLGGWEEEVYYSWYQMGNIVSKINPNDINSVIHNYFSAYEACPRRIEALACLKFYLEKRGYSKLAENWLMPLLRGIKHPGQGLFLEDYYYFLWNQN